MEIYTNYVSKQLFCSHNEQCNDYMMLIQYNHYGIKILWIS